MTTTAPTLVDDEMSELVDADFPRVDLVGKAANGTRFILMKSEEGNLLSADAVRELINKAEEPNVTDAATDTAPAEVVKETATEPVEEVVEKADLDVTEVLAEPDGGVNAMANDPGSKEWESVDAATAAKWAAIAARLENAIGTLAARENVEAASGNGDGDGMNAFMLEDAAGAVGFAGDILAAYGNDEAQTVAIEEDVAKAVAVLKGAERDLPTYEALAPVVKAGKVLSAANESAIRSAKDKLQSVIDSLPAPVAKEEAEASAPVDEPVEKSEAAEVDADVSRETSEVEKAAEPAAAIVGEVELQMIPGGAIVEKGVDFMPLTGTIEELAPIIKAAAMQAVFNENGKLIGAVKPTAITPLDGGGASDAVEADPNQPAPEPAPVAAAPAAQPAAPAAAPAAPVAKEAEPDEKVITLTKSELADVLKEALDARSAENAEVIKSLEEKVDHLMAPAVPRVRLHGLGDPAALRANARESVTKAEELVDVRKQFDEAGTPQEQNAARDVLTAAAMEQLQAQRALRR